MKNNDFKDFDLSNFIELTEDQLRFEVNGGWGHHSSSSSSSSSSSRSNSSSSSSSSRRSSSASHEVANTNHAVANAKPGDTVTRNNGTTVPLTKGDISWAKAHDNTPSAAAPATAPSNPKQTTSQTSTTTETSSKTSDKSYTNGSRGSSASSSSSSYGSYVGYSGNGSGNSDSAEQAIMNAARHDPDYNEHLNHGIEVPVDKIQSKGKIPLNETENQKMVNQFVEFQKSPTAKNFAKVFAKRYGQTLMRLKLEKDTENNERHIKYSREDKMQCDNYAADVLTYGFFDYTDYMAGNPSINSVDDHIAAITDKEFILIDNEKNKNVTINDDTMYLVFMGAGTVDSHCGILDTHKNSNGKWTWYDNSGNNTFTDESGKTIKGGVKKRYFDSEQAITGWYDSYKEFYFQEIKNDFSQTSY